jgi:hypothetical protein
MRKSGAAGRLLTSSSVSIKGVSMMDIKILAVKKARVDDLPKLMPALGLKPETGRRQTEFVSAKGISIMAWGLREALFKIDQIAFEE